MRILLLRRDVSEIRVSRKARGARSLAAGLLLVWSPGLVADVPGPELLPATPSERTVTFWAVDGSSNERLPSQDACRVVVEQAALANARRLPCGTPHALAAGQYRYWVETDTRMSPAQYVLEVAAVSESGGEAWNPAREIEVPTVGAGRIGLSPQASVTPSTALVLMHTDGQSWFGQPPGHALLREVTGEKVTGGVRMPAGRVFAAAYDRASRTYAALARPAWIYAGTVTYVTPQPPAPGTGDCWVVLERPAEGAARHAAVALRLDGSAGTREPDLVIDERDRLQAVWFGMAKGPARVTVESAQLELVGPAVFTVPSGQVTAFRGQLRTKPAEAGAAAEAP